MVLLPDGGSKDEVQGSDFLSPRKLVADLEPLSVLGDHGVDDTGESLIGSEETMTSGEKVAFKPAFAKVLGEHGVDDAAIGG